MNRIVAFLLGCVPVRAFFIYIAYAYPSYAYYLAFPAIAIGLAFIILRVANLRQTGFEVNHERIWWNNLRPVHGLLYLTFAYLALQKNPLAYVALVIDLVFGVFAFTVFHAFLN